MPDGAAPPSFAHGRKPNAAFGLPLLHADRARVFAATAHQLWSKRPLSAALFPSRHWPARQHVIISSPAVCAASTLSSPRQPCARPARYRALVRRARGQHVIVPSPRRARGQHDCCLPPVMLGAALYQRLSPAFGEDALAGALTQPASSGRRQHGGNLADKTVTHRIGNLFVPHQADIPAGEFTVQRLADYVLVRHRHRALR